MLGENYKELVDRYIRREAKEREANSEFEYGIDAWDGINEDTKFYINQDGNVVVVLPKYEIAPGAAGSQEFEIN